MYMPFTHRYLKGDRFTADTILSGDFSDCLYGCGAGVGTGISGEKAQRYEQTLLQPFFWTGILWNGDGGGAKAVKADGYRKAGNPLEG